MCRDSTTLPRAAGTPSVPRGRLLTLGIMLAIAGVAAPSSWVFAAVAATGALGLLIAVSLPMRGVWRAFAALDVRRLG